MKKKMPTPIKDGLIGLAFGTCGIIPGIAGGSVLLIAKVYKKFVNAIAHLFSKQFFKNFLILLPFGIGAMISFVGLSIPMNLALNYIRFAIVCLFGGLILGSLPGVYDNVRGQPSKISHKIVMIVFLVFVAFIGVLSLIFKNYQPTIDSLFEQKPFYLYFILFGVGFLGAAGFVVPGFSGAMLFLAIGFYDNVLALFSTENFGINVSLLATVFVGIFAGVIFFSKVMNHFMNKHKLGTYYASIGMIAGSLVAIFVNSKMFDYLGSDAFGLADQILAPILLVVGFLVAFIFVRYFRRHPEIKEDAEN